MGYFLCLNVSIDITNAAKATANINASNTDTSITHFPDGSEPPPLSINYLNDNYSKQQFLFIAYKL